LPTKKVLVIGLGEVGRPLFELIKESGEFEAFGLDTDQAKMKSLQQTAPPKKVDVIHICLPFKGQKEFASIVTDYIKRFEPRLTIINSTVPPGTTASLFKRSENFQIAHSPIRGVHKGNEHMKWEIGRWTKYVGGATEEAAEAAARHFEKLRLKTKVLADSTETELAKLFETTYRAWMISCFQEMHRISTHFKSEFDNIVDFLEDTHRVRLDRPIMFPGEIGGHCIIPNTQLLIESYDSEFLRFILKSNERRKQEMKDPKIRREAETTKKRSEKLQKDLMDKWTGK
jgi:UDP-N-acetyl-D-mannosaminuronate dehydrogenase